MALHAGPRGYSRLPQAVALHSSVSFGKAQTPAGTASSRHFRFGCAPSGASLPASSTWPPRLGQINPPGSALSQPGSARRLRVPLPGIVEPSRQTLLPRRQNCTSGVASRRLASYRSDATQSRDCKHRWREASKRRFALRWLIGLAVEACAMLHQRWQIASSHSLLERLAFGVARSRCCDLRAPGDSPVFPSSVELRPTPEDATCYASQRVAVCALSDALSLMPAAAVLFACRTVG